jgi:hypothetical protein
MSGGGRYEPEDEDRLKGQAEKWMALSIFIRIGPVVPPNMNDPLPDGIGPAHAPDRPPDVSTGRAIEYGDFEIDISEILGYII